MIYSKIMIILEILSIPEDFYLEVQL